jgi:hypothetical protein
MLDKLAPEWRHLVIIIVPVLIAWVTQEIPNWNLPVSLSALIGVLASAILLWFTGVTKQYGLFQNKE